MQPLSESDLRETFGRSRGPGGQHVNKTSTAVTLLHIPTGIRVTIDTSRSQAANRATARATLAAKVAQAAQARAQATRAAASAARRRTARRSRTTKTRILETKRHRAQTKKQRAPIKPHTFQHS